MPKRLFIVLILFIAMLVGLYQLRVQLLTTAFNTALQNNDSRLLRIDGMEIAWDGVDIDRLVLGLGKDQVQQTLEGVHIAFSVLDIKAHSLEVKHAALKLPDSGDSQDDEPLRLSDLLDQIIAVPLEFIDIADLEVEGFSAPALNPPFSLRASWKEKHVLLEANDQKSELRIEFDRAAADKSVLAVYLDYSGRPTVELKVRVSRQGNTQHLTGEGKLWADAALPLLKNLVDLPGLLSAASGELQFQLTTEMADELQRGSLLSWQLQVLPLTTLELALTNIEAEVTLQLGFPQPLLLTWPSEAPQESALSLSGKAISWQAQEALNKLSAVGQASEINCHYAVVLECQAVLDLKINAPELTFSGAEPVIFQNPAIELVAQLETSDDRVNVTLASGEWLRAESIAQGDTLALSPVLVIDSGGQLNYRGSTGELSLAADRLRVLLPRVQMPGVNVATMLSMQSVQLLSNADGQVNASAHLRADAVNLQRPNTWLPALAFDADVAMAGQGVAVSGQIQGGGQIPLFEFSGNYQLDTGRGDVQIVTKSLSFDERGKRLSQHFNDWPFDWDIFEGQLMLDVDIKWRDGEQGAAFEGSIKQQSEGLAGFYKDIGFVGLDSHFVAALSGPGQLKTKTAATVSLDSLDVGVPIENIRARFFVDTARQILNLESVEAELFEGRVWIEDAVYRTEQPHNPIFVGIDGLQLDQLLELAGYEAIQATGTISGLLPLDVNKAGLTMKRGMLAAKAPGGVFQYHTEIVAGTNPAMVQVIEALRNYQYSIFQVEADYLENGDLVLAMILRGSNPDLQQGRPIHLNLNVTDNIPTLLKSLQSGRVIADTVSKKLGGGSK